MVSVTALDVPYCVVTVTSPVQLFVGASKEMEVLPHEVVGKDTPFSFTVPGDERKFWPVIVTVAPSAAGVVMLVITGSGMLTVTVADADFVESVWLVAFTVTVCWDEMLAGAVYKPEELMVPVDGLIDQVTAVLLAFVTVAENC